MATCTAYPGPVDKFCGTRGGRGTLAPMSFDDLPPDWPTRSLADEAFAADVLDLCVSDADRMTGGLSVLLCRADGSLSQPVFVGEIPHETGLREAVSAVALSCVSLVGVGGVVIGIVRRRGGVEDRDRRVHQHCLEVCRRAGLDLHGTFVVTPGGITPLPVAQQLRPRQDVA